MNTPSPTPRPCPLRRPLPGPLLRPRPPAARSAVVLLLAVAGTVGAGLLSWLAQPSLAGAALTAASVFGGVRGFMESRVPGAAVGPPVPADDRSEGH